MSNITSQLTDILGSEPTVYGPKYRWQLSDMFDFTLYQKPSGRYVLSMQHVFDDERIASVECNEPDVMDRAKMLVQSAVNSYQLELQRVQDIRSRFPQ